MGVDLMLMPVLFKNSWLCHEMIECCRDRELWDEISSLGEIPVGRPVQSYFASSEGKYGDTFETPYGTKLTWLPAGKLSAVLRGNSAWKNKAIAALLAEYPDDWPVVLYWH